jgi:hypothetical protein
MMRKKKISNAFNCVKSSNHQIGSNLHPFKATRMEMSQQNVPSALQSTHISDSKK